MQRFGHRAAFGLNPKIRFGRGAKRADAFAQGKRGDKTALLGKVDQIGIGDTDSLGLGAGKSRLGLGLITENLRLGKPQRPAVRVAARPLWLLDEPLVSLDQAGILCLSQLMQEHLAAGGLVVVTSHQPLPLDWPLTQGVVL